MAKYSALAVDAGDIAPGKDNKPIFDELHIRFINLLLKRLKHTITSHIQRRNDGGIHPLGVL